MIAPLPTAPCVSSLPAAGDTVSAFAISITYASAPPPPSSTSTSKIHPNVDALLRFLYAGRAISVGSASAAADCAAAPDASSAGMPRIGERSSADAARAGAGVPWRGYSLRPDDCARSWPLAPGPDGSLDGRMIAPDGLPPIVRDTPERVSHTSDRPLLCVPGRVDVERTMPSSSERVDNPGLSVATTCASVFMPRICATATPRPDKHLLSSYSSASIVCGRWSGLRAIALATSSETCSGSSVRTVIGAGGSIVAFFVRISMKLSPVYGGNPVVISYMIAPSE